METKTNATEESRIGLAAILRSTAISERLCREADRRLQCIKRLIDVYIYHDQKEVTEVIAAWEEARKILVEADQCVCPRSFNAKLIAFAPEMLELLERIVGDYGEVISGENCEQAVDLISRINIS